MKRKGPSQDELNRIDFYLYLDHLDSRRNRTPRPYVNRDSIEAFDNVAPPLTPPQPLSCPDRPD